MRLFYIWLILQGSLFLCGCTESEEEADNTVNLETYQANGLRISSEQMPDASFANITQSYHDYAFSEFLAHTPSYQNSIIAPFDWQQFMAMLSLGAEGATLDAFSTASMLNFNLVAMYEDVSVWEQALAANPAIDRVSYLWGQSGYRFSLDYLQQQAELFGPQMSAYDFRLDSYQARLEISDTLFISDYLADSKTRLVTAQTTHLNSGWSSLLRAEAVIARFGGAVEQQWVEMVKLDGQLNLYEGASFKAVQVPLSDAGLSLMVITPNEGSYAEVRNNLTSAFWNQLINNLSVADTSVYVPTFILERELMADDLPYLGVALSDQLANFSAINNAGFLYSQQPEQRISLSVDETGVSSVTKNIAVHTAMENEPEILFDFSVVFNAGNSANLVFFAVTASDPVPDKDCFYPPDQSPFIFSVYDMATNTLLYLGQITTRAGNVVTADWQVPYYAECGAEPPVDVYKVKGSLQCDSASGVGYLEMQQELTNAGIEVLEASESHDGLIRVQVCGAPDGLINVFSIRQNQLSEAQALGFNLLSVQ